MGGKSLFTFENVAIGGGALLIGYFLFSRRDGGAYLGDSSAGGSTSIYEQVREITTMGGETITEIRDIISGGTQILKGGLDITNQSLANISDVVDTTAQLNKQLLSTGRFTINPIQRIKQSGLAFAQGDILSGFNRAFEATGFGQFLNIPTNIFESLKNEGLKISKPTESIMPNGEIARGTKTTTLRFGTPALVGADFSIKPAVQGTVTTGGVTSQIFSVGGSRVLRALTGRTGGGFRGGASSGGGGSGGTAPKPSVGESVGQSLLGKRYSQLRNLFGRLKWW